ncbi:MAG: hypothetical protein BIFFINMI_00033 [Phycisphaerae bacterium]|nr:hypothetical protein [Phycisphaerae bacterium]
MSDKTTQTAATPGTEGSSGNGHAVLERLRANIESVFMGKRDVVDLLLTALVAGGHLLIEDVPGVGKTVLARALAKSLDATFARIQLTPDLLPSDILGVSVYSQQTGTFEFKRGPIFAHVILADEINRTTPRTQSALLEAMNEAQVTVDGTTMTLPDPFMVLATQNPFEFEGTYFLPENQLDRFLMRLRIGYPARDDELRILRATPSAVALPALTPVAGVQQIVALQSQARQVSVEDNLLDYLLRIVQATRDHEQLHIGVSPRGALALKRASQAFALLHGRDYVVPDDLKTLAAPVFAHRLVGKGYLQDGQDGSADVLMAEILNEVPAPQ